MIIYGKNPVVEAIRNKRNISKMVVVEGLKDQNFLKFLKENRIKYELLPQHVISKRYGDKTGGIVAEINEYEYATLEEVLNKTSKKPEGGVLMLLDGLEDPHNFGAIIRTAESMGIKNIIIPRDRSVVVNETVMKTSAGTLNFVNIIQVSNLVNAINYLKDKKWRSSKDLSLHQMVSDILNCDDILVDDHFKSTLSKNERFANLGDADKAEFMNWLKK